MRRAEREQSKAYMNLFTVMVTSVALLAPMPTEAQTVAITRAGSRPVQAGPTENFTGSARVERLFDAVDPSHAGGGSVTFEPGARTAWHSHPRGQILIVTAGTGRVQGWGGPVEEIRTGDVVRIPAGQKHWHGGSPRASMTRYYRRAVTIVDAEELGGVMTEKLAELFEENSGLPARGAPRRRAVA
jgi:4-carboxymuconolactone decarboxylase